MQNAFNVSLGDLSEINIHINKIFNTIFPQNFTTLWQFRNAFQRKLQPYNNQSTDLQNKSTDWFLYDASFNERYFQTDCSAMWILLNNIFVIINSVFHKYNMLSQVPEFCTLAHLKNFEM